MKCQYCYAENESGARFCTNCGAALAQETPVEEVVTAVEETPVEEVVTAVEETPAEEVVAAVEETPVEEVVAAVEETPVEEVIAAVEETPVEETPVEEVIAPVEGVVEAPAVDSGKTMNLVSLILGIASLVFGSMCSCAFACLGGLVPGCMGIAAIITGILGMKKSKADGFKGTLGLIGMILGIASLLVIFVFIIVNAIIGGVAYSDAFNSGYYY